MKSVPGSRYCDGLVIAEWNSHTGSDQYAPDGMSSPEDHIVKRLYVKAKPTQGRPKDYTLVGIVEVEVVAIEDGEDQGHFEVPTHQVYEMPFPHDLQTRKQVLRQMQEAPKFNCVR